MFVSWSLGGECCALSGGGLCDGIPAECVACLTTCDSELSITRSPWPARACGAIWGEGVK